METLIEGIVKKTATLLPSESASSAQTLKEIRTNAASLIKLAEFHLDAVIEGLLHLYSTVVKSYASLLSGEHQPSHEVVERYLRSKFMVFQLFDKTLSAVINNRKLELRFDDDLFTIENDELFEDKEEEEIKKEVSSEENKESVQVEEKKELPKLHDDLAESLLKYILETLNFSDKPEAINKSPIRLRHLAARVLFRLSIINFDIVFKKIDNFMKEMKPDQVDLDIFGMIEYICFDSWKLSRLITLLNDSSSKFKSKAFTAIANPLRMAIWNWITNYPHQFISLCRNKSSLPGNPIALFETIHSWASSEKKRRAYAWPVLTMLLLLCPEVFSTVFFAIKKDQKNDTRKKERKFLQSLMKAIKEKKSLSDIAVICFVDLFKASTYLSKNDFQALRFLFSDMHNDIQERLMNPSSTPVRRSDGQLDIPLMVDFLVSSFRLNQRHVISYLFPILLRDKSVYKLVLTKALLQLAREGQALEWHPTLAVTYSYLAKPIRLLFQDLVQEVQKARQNQSSQDQLMRSSFLRRPTVHSLVDQDFSTETLLTLLAVFYTDPKLVLENTSGNANQHINDILYLFAGLCNCLGDKNSVQIQNQAYRLLLKLFDTKYISLWCPQDVSTGFIELSSSVLTQFACSLVADKDIQGENIRTILQLMKELTSSANRFIAKNKDQITEKHLKSRKRIQSLENTEAALLILLCSTEYEIWSTAASCFGDLCDQIDILGDKEIKVNSIYCNYALYRKLSAVEELGKDATAQQQGIRRLLRRVEIQTKANLSAFIEVYSRWKNYTKSLPIYGKTKEGILDDMSDQQITKMQSMWKNYTTFLCSLGGVLLQSGDKVFSGGKKKEHNTLSDDLIKDLMELIISENGNVQKTVTTTIGVDLSPALYNVLFSNMHAKVKGFFGDEGALKITQDSTQFVQQAITIVQLILEQAQNNTKDLESVNFETLILSFVQYCSGMVKEKELIKRMKSNICILVERLMQKKQFIKFEDEIQFKFSCLEKIIEWTSDYQMQMTEKVDGPKMQDDDDTFYRHLDVLCMRSIASLLEDLDFSKLKRGERSMTAKERELADQKDFQKYFRLLSRYLKKCQTEKEQKQQLREYTILALGNLLEANINFGLRSFLKISYFKDQETRSAFLHVLTNITKKGINLKKKEQEQGKDKYGKLLDLFMKKGLHLPFITLSVINISDQDALCASLVRLFEDRGMALDMIKRSIDMEVENTKEKGTMFRANSTASKMLTAYLNYIGKDYLISTLSDLVNMICINYGNFEVDPNKIKEGEDLNENVANLTSYAQSFLDCVLLSEADMPGKIRIICNYLATKVAEKFPGGEKSKSDSTIQQNEDEEENLHEPKHVAIGGLLFLRFLCPAIVSPHNHGLVDTPPDPKAMRCLLLITKSLQNVANGVKFGDRKENYMKPLDQFIMNNLKPAKEFFEDLSTIPEGAEDEPPVHYPSAEMREEDLVTLHRTLYMYNEKILQKAKEPEFAKIPGLLEDAQELSQIIKELGKPPEQAMTKGPQYLGKDFKSTLLIEFMKQMKNRDISRVEEAQIFYTRGVSNAQRPVLYFIPRNFDKDFNKDEVLYHILNTMQNVFTKPYTVLVDCTNWSEVSAVSIKDVEQLLRYLPPGARKNIKMLIFYNPNTYFRSNVKYLERKLISKKLSNKIVFATEEKELNEFIDSKNAYLPESTQLYESNVQMTFSPAWVIVNNQPKKAIIKISNKNLNIITLDETIFGKKVRLIDFITMMSIQKIEMIAENDVPYVVVTHYPPSHPKGVKTYMRTEVCEQLLQAIRECKFRQQADISLGASLENAEDEDLRQEDIPGSMLNMCFLNLESNNPQTRTAAYNLLAALAEQFDFPVTLVEAKDMCVPHNTGDLVVALSKQVAKAKPFLTAQFLRECLKGFTKVQLPYQYLCLKYMKPWLKNLSKVYKETEAQDDNAQMARIRDWFNELTKTTCTEAEIYPALLSEIWGELSKDAPLIAIAMDCIMQQAEPLELGNPKLDILNDLVITLASKNCSDLVVRIIVDKIMDVFDNEIENDDTELEPWKKVTIYARFLLMLSFQNRINVVDNLTTLIHIILLTAGRGSIYMRATMHALTLNIIHSLSTAIKFTSEDRKEMQNHLAKLSTPEYRTMFMGNDKVSYDPFIKPTKKDKSIPNITMWHIESITNFFLDVMKTCYRVDASLEKRWHEDWSTLCKTKAVHTNPVILPRLLTVYGVLVRPTAARDSLPFVLHCLINSLSNYSNHRMDMAVATLLCLGQFCYKIPPDEPIFKRLVLIPIILIAASDPELYPPVVHLLECIFGAISNSQSFKECSSLEEYFNKHCRDETTEPIISKLEQITGISFKTNFAFAMATFLMKGLTLNSTKTMTTQICTTLIHISGKLNSNVSDILGFLTALITYNYDDIQALLGENNSLFTEENFSHPSAALLFTRYLLTIVQNIEKLDSKQFVIYKVLLAGFEKIPKVFAPVYREVMPRIIQVYNNAKRPKIAEISLKLINTMMLNPEAALAKDDGRSLQRIQFNGLYRAGSFRAMAEYQNQLLTLVLEFTNELIGESKYDSLPGVIAEKKQAKKRQQVQEKQKNEKM